MTASTAHRIVSLLVLLALLIQPLTVTAAYPAAEAAGPTVQAAHQVDPQKPGFLFRATVTLAGSRNLARLEKTGVLVLRTVEGDGAQSALVLADGEQLADLARLGFKPRAADELRLLVNAQGPQKQWLAASLAPLLTQADTAAEQWAVAQQQATAEQQAAAEVAGAAGAAATPDALALQALRTSLQAMTPEQIAGTADSVSVDDDADGLTNTQEAWWCTDPLDADTDDDGRTDGAEIQALKDWMGNQRESAPGETPWPSWPFNTSTCPDKDHDSIPNLAEQWELGLNMDWESSDRDKFDDGQELFGVTYCPGGDLSCGYGDLPRSSDSGYVGATMPSWVKAPGKHPLVAAFPIPEVDVVESSLHVQTVTTVTTDYTIASGTEESYSTAKTEGTSTSVSDSETWNNWQEVSRTVPDTVTAATSQTTISGLNWDFWTAKETLNETIEAACFVPPGETGYPWVDFGIQLGCFAHDVGGLINEGIYYGALYGPEIVTSVTEGLDELQSQVEQGIHKLGQNVGKSYNCIRNTVDRFADTLSTLEWPTGGGEQSLSVDVNNQVTVRPSFQIQFPTQRPTTTQSRGQSWGGSRTTTHEQYEEHTATNGEAFSSEESWGNAIAVDSAHTADLWFTYNVRNAGTEYAREIADLAFNVYIGDDPNPVYTYFVGPDLGGDGKFHNFMPTEEHTYTARHISLTLEQMKAVDLGGPIRVVVEDFTYGADELFYQDAANAGVLLAMEDGTDDGDEIIDTYLVPTWGAETVLDVLGRYFPHETDAGGMMTSVWTPEQRADTPAWCVKPVRTGNTLWCKHALSTSDWWNIYTNGMGDGSEGFQDTLAAPGQTALFRFNKDTDLDGYSDRSEEKLGTDQNDPASYPKPELLAGVHSIRNGSDVVATLSLLNTGLYDAYGVEAVMIAPDDTTDITNNTVGGSGRVRAQRQMIVGSRILLQSPLPAAWTQAGHAQPAPGGYYTGSADRTYTFTVNCSSPGGCDVGSGTWSLAWNDGDGATGSLSFADGYLSPTLLDVGTHGLKLGLLSGKVYNGDSLTVEARTPRDTFKYTIAEGHEDDYTPPIVLVSYNDPQGNHRFVVPADAMELVGPTDNLMAFSGQMLMEPGVEIVTSGPFSVGANTTDLVVNNPTQTQLTGAHLFLEFIDPQGVVVSEIPVTVNLPAGPSVVPIAWDSGSFDPAYDPAKDYIVMAFWTDYQGNILDTAARPLSSFQEDPKPAFVMASDDETWDFGTAQQGTLMQRQVTLASVGYGDLLTHVSNATGMSVEGPAAGAGLLPGDTGVYTLTLNTQYLPVGPFEETIEIRTNDPTNPTKTITIHGDLTAMPEDAPGGATIRPLDVPVTVSGDQDDWVEFTHTLAPDPQSLHPVKVYSQDFATLWGMGKYATDFGQGTASYDMFGDGRDGVMPSSGNLDNNNGVGVAIVNSGSQGAYTINVTDARAGSRINIGDVVLIHQTQGTSAGCWELNEAVSDYAGGTATIQLAKPLQCNYASGGNNHAQVQRVPQYTDCPVNGTVTPLSGWNGMWGGIFAVMCSGTMNLAGSINASGLGFGGGTRSTSNSTCGQQGEGTPGVGQSVCWQTNGNGGGGGMQSPGGGGGNGSIGQQGESYGGYGGSTAGSEDLSISSLGGGGGGGAWEGGDPQAGDGGRGGGSLFLMARHFSVLGSATASGQSGQNSSHRGGGGGSGGSILVRSMTIELGSNLLTAVGGLGGEGEPQEQDRGGDGGVGRIRVEYCESPPAFSTNPTASTQKLNCYIADQAADPTHGLLNLPEFGSSTYRVQYGRRYVFPGSGNQSQSIRMPRQLYATATMDALVSNTGVSSGDLNLSLDIGADGTNDWTHNQTSSFPAALSITDIADALNAYIIDQTGVAWGADIDVPVKLTINRQADVILTNLVLTLQSNQPGTATAASVDLGADRPLDVPVTVTGTHNPGEGWEFSHPLGPEPQSLHPVKLYSADYGVLHGLGEFGTGASSFMKSYEEFGDGKAGNLTVGSGQTVYTDDWRVALTATSAAGQKVVNVSTSAGLNIGDELLIIGVQSTGAGDYEFGTVAAVGSGTVMLTKDLQRTYSPRTQVVRVPHYADVTVQSGGTLTAHGWDGSTGGIVAFRSNGTTTIAGLVTANHLGYRGNLSVSPTGTQGYVGEGHTGENRVQSPNAYGNAGGGGPWAGSGEVCCDGTGGGGGGNGTPGGRGYSDKDKGHQQIGGYGGGTSGNSELTNMTFGGSGGEAYGHSNNQNQSTVGGKKGGGIIFIAGRDVAVRGALESRGADTSTATSYANRGGAGAGGSILLRARTAAIGSARVVAVGGIDDHSEVGGDTAWGGAGGAGRVRIEYCTSLSGTANPGANSQPTHCYHVSQVDASPYNLGRLALPEAVSTSAAYWIQYGRRYNFAAAGTAEKPLRLRKQTYGAATLDALVNNTGAASGPLTLTLYIGPDATADWTHTNSAQPFPAELTTTNLASALNAYLQTRNDIAWGADIDVPFRVETSRASDVMLTNLALTPVGAKTRFLRLQARDYSEVTLDILFGDTGDPAGLLAFTVDVGADGTVDWTDSQDLAYPATVHSPNLAAAFNSYLSGRSGEVDVPIRITPSPSLFTALDAFAATPSAQPDATLGSADISFGTADPVEGDELGVFATLHNSGGHDSGPLVASFFATTTDWGEWYIGSAFVSNVPAGGAVQAEILWNTLGFTGDVPIRVSIDPYDRLAETDETNNGATTNLAIKTRPDLRVTEIALSDDEPVAGEAVEVTVTVHNYGQTAPAGSVLALYDGNPDAAGSELTTGLLAPAPGADATLTYTWTPDGPGAHRLFARTDPGGNVSEYDEGNNDTWRDVYIGFASPLQVDSGGGNAYDPAYSAALGFGYLNGDASTFCGTSSNGSQRSDWSGKVQYRFDHLLPGHFYHLDLTLYECDGLDRQEQVRIDDNLISDPIDLSDLAPHRLSFRLDPALYADRSIVVSIEELLGNNAVVSEINLYDIDYRYADAGGNNDPQYPSLSSDGRHYGWLDGAKQDTPPWGTLPYQTRRIEGSDNELRYRFDGLRSDKYYQLLITVYQGLGTTTVQQTVAVDSVDTGITLEVTGVDRDDKVIDVPTGMYTGDGSITVRITRLGALAGAFINEIALEELTLLPDQVTQVTQSMDVHTGGPNWFSFNVKPPVRPAVACTGVTATSAFTNLYGSVLLGDAAAPVGTIVEAYTPGGVKTGCFKVAAEGLYGYMRVYGAEGATPGMQPGDPIILKVNGITASPTPYPVVWQDDKGTHQIDLVAPDVIPVETLLASIGDKVTKLQCENGTYLSPPADPRFNTCTTVAPGQGYLLWTNAATALSVTGSRVAADEPVELHAGYNWLGYLPTCELAATAALASIAGKYDILHSETGTYKPPPANPDYNTFNTMAPGKGYMIHMTEAATLIYPADLCGAAQNVAETAFTCPAAATSRFTHFYGHVTPVEDAPPGAVILAYSPRGEVVGCGEVREDGLYPYLRVYGAEDAQPGMQEGEPVRFTVNGRITLKSTEAIWQNDWDVHPLDLTVGGIEFHLPMIWR